MPAGRATIIDRSAAAAAAVAVAGALRFRGAITGIQKRRVEVSEAQQLRPGRAGQGRAGHHNVNVVRGGRKPRG